MADHQRTFAQDDHLPRVPLPSLRQSCRRFLRWCAPLLSAEDLTKTEDAVESFLRPDSPTHALQAALERYDAEEGVHSWLDAFWQDRYLGRRDRIALNANYFFLFEDSPLGQIERAATLTAAAVAYKQLIDTQALPPVVQRGQTLSMEQNRYLFSATRIPGVPRDSARTPYSAECPGPSPARHVVVFFRGTMFRLDVIAPDGRPYGTGALAAGLRAVLTADAAPSDTSVGHLTTKARAEWAASRQTLLDIHPGNAAQLDAVETALFCLCLEDTTPGNPQRACDALLRGEDGNRWYDKSFSLIVFPDGTAGLNGEHCQLDGTTIIGFIDAILGAPDQPEVDPTASPPAPRRIEFLLDDALRADIRDAAEGFAAHAADTATTTVSIANFTSTEAKQLHVSPDAFAQLAFQLAQHRARGHLGATYESIATRQFRHGRTEAMRVVTPEIVRFVTVMADPAAGHPTRRAAFRAAADQHVERAKQCQAGHAPEQHLWELQLLQQRLGGGPPLALYESPGWLTMRQDYLSTSAVPSPHVRFWGFGSTGATCIGVGYALLPDRFDLFLSAPRAIAEQLSAFAEALPRAVLELHDLLAAEPTR